MEDDPLPVEDDPLPVEDDPPPVEEDTTSDSTGPVLGVTSLNQVGGCYACLISC